MLEDFPFDDDDFFFEFDLLYADFFVDLLLLYADFLELEYFFPDTFELLDFDFVLDTSLGALLELDAFRTLARLS